MKGSGRVLKGREPQMVTHAMGAAMQGPIYSLGESEAQHGSHGIRLRL